MKDENTKAQLLKNTKTQMRKGVLEMCILSIISEKEIYTSDIIKRLDIQNSEHEIKEGTIYPLLTRLKKLGLLSYSWKESEVGPPRKYYEITEEGADILNELHASWNQLIQVVNKSIPSTKTKSKAKPKASAKK